MQVTKLKTRLAAVALGVLGLGGSVQANTIDLFTDPGDFTTHRVEDVLVGGASCSDGNVSGSGCFQEYVGANILGGARDIYTEVVSNASGAPRSTMYAGGGILDFSNSGSTVGRGVVQWDGTDNSAALDIDGLNSANLITQTGCPVGGCDRIVASVLLADLGFEYYITVFDMDGDSSRLTADTQAAITALTSVDYQFNWFNLANGTYTIDGLTFDIDRGVLGGGTGAIDFTRIGALQFDINTAGTIAVDLQLASITKTGLPEPGALALVSLALLGAGVTSRRRKDRQV